MTLTARLAACHERSVALYLKRQAVELERLRCQQQATVIDQELIMIDGQVEMLSQLIADEKDQATDKKK